MEAVRRVFVFLELEVEDAHGVDFLEVIAPIFSSHGLVLDGEGGIEHTAVFVKLLVGVLHLDDEVVAVFVLAIHVENGAAVAVLSEMLAGQIADVRDDLLPLEEGIKETDEQIFVHLGTE